MLHGEHSAILSTFIKLPFVIKIFVSGRLRQVLLYTIGKDIQSILSSKVWVGSFPSIISFVSGTQNNRLNETVLEYPQYMIWLSKKKNIILITRS